MSVGVIVSEMLFLYSDISALVWFDKHGIGQLMLAGISQILVHFCFHDFQSCSWVLYFVSLPLQVALINLSISMHKNVCKTKTL